MRRQTGNANKTLTNNPIIDFIPLLLTMHIYTYSFVQMKVVINLSDMKKCSVSIWMVMLLFSFLLVAHTNAAQQLISNDKKAKKEVNTIFYAIGDTPYSIEQSKRLSNHMKNNIPKDTEFIIHVGDVTTDNNCPKAEYQRAVQSLKVSPVPVFIIRTFSIFVIQYFFMFRCSFFKNLWHHVFLSQPSLTIPFMFIFTTYIISSW